MCILVAERAGLGASGRAVLTLVNDRRATHDAGPARADFACLSDFISGCEGSRHAAFVLTLPSPLAPQRCLDRRGHRPHQRLCPSQSRRDSRRLEWNLSWHRLEIGSEWRLGVRMATLTPSTLLLPRLLLGIPPTVVLALLPQRQVRPRQAGRSQANTNPVSRAHTLSIYTPQILLYLLRQFAPAVRAPISLDHHP